MRPASFQRFFDFHNHVSPRENFCCLLNNFRAGFYVVLVGVAGTETGIRFHQNGVTMLGKLNRARRQQRNTLLLFLNFLWYTDDHGAK